MQKKAPQYLKKTEAYARRKLIQPGLEYKMFLCLRKGDVYQGYTSVKFTALSTVRKIIQIYLKNFKKNHGFLK